MVLVDQNKSSVSGQDKAVTHQSGYDTYTVTWDNLGYATVTGNVSNPAIGFMIAAIQELTKTPNGPSELGRIAKENMNFVHWSDFRIVMGIVSNPITKGVNPEKTTYRAGGRIVTENQLFWLFYNIKSQNQSNVLWDYNSEVKKWIANEESAIEDKDKITADPNSPFNPNGQYYSPDQKVLSYDADNGYIIYQSGAIIWTKSGGKYFESANGEATSYDAVSQTVTFSNGSVLNLITLELVKTDKTIKTIQNALPWYEEIFRKLLSDTKTQLTVLAAIVILLIIKKKRSDED